MKSKYLQYKHTGRTEELQICEPIDDSAFPEPNASRAFPSETIQLIETTTHTTSLGSLYVYLLVLESYIYYATC